MQRSTPSPTGAATPTSRRRRSARLAAPLVATLLVIAGCSASESSESAAGNDAATAVETSDETADTDTDTGSADESTAIAASTENQDSHFDETDLDYDESAVVPISLDGASATADSDAVSIDGSTVTISAAGTYSLSGSLADGQVVVDVADTDDVILILDGVEITNADGAAIAVMEADSAVVMLADGTTNQLTDGATYSFPDADTDEPNATLYSAADLTIAGTGDVLVAISGGAIDATSVDDAIHSNNEVVIDDGTITLASGDDGIHGDLAVTINGGTITISDSFEGIESEIITINDGVIDVTSNDDGLNVASAEASTTTEAVDPGAGRGGAPGGAPGDEAVGDYYIYINGGTIAITVTGALAEQGDGIDANGHIVMTGGVVAVSGPTDTRNSALDYSGGSFTMSGGLLIGTNIDGRNSEGVGTGSSQASLYLTSGSTISAGTVVHIESADGESLVTFEPENDYSVIVFSSPDLVAGESYDIYLGGSVSVDSATGLYDDGEYTPGDLAGTVTASS